MDQEFREIEIARLYYAYKLGESLSEAELKTLNDWLDESPANRAFIEQEMTKDTIRQDLDRLKEKDDKVIKAQIVEKISADGEPLAWTSEKKGRVAPMYLRYGAI